MGDQGLSKAVVPAGERQPSKEEVMAALQAFRQQLEANGAGGLGQNEQGEDFIEISEEWDDSLHGSSTVAAAPAPLAATDASPADLEDALEDGEEFDEAEFEEMMLEMEELELEGTTAAAPTPPKKPTGIKKGFLLNSGGLEEENKEEKQVAAVEKPAVAEKKEKEEQAVAAPLKTFAVGQVVERQPGGTEAPATLSNAPPPPAPAEPQQQQQQRVSRFKMRHMTAGGS